jgi:hypothetical protein
MKVNGRADLSRITLSDIAAEAERWNMEPRQAHARAVAVCGTSSRRAACRRGRCRHTCVGAYCRPAPKAAELICDDALARRWHPEGETGFRPLGSGCRRRGSSARCSGRRRRSSGSRGKSPIATVIASTTRRNELFMPSSPGAHGGGDVVVSPCAEILALNVFTVAARHGGGSRSPHG